MACIARSICDHRAALFRIIEHSAPTLILDEAENVINDKDNSLYGVLNAGHALNRRFQTVICAILLRMQNPELDE